jgi:hypothetical protein
MRKLISDARKVRVARDNFTGLYALVGMTKEQCMALAGLVSRGTRELIVSPQEKAIARAIERWIMRLK